MTNASERNQLAIDMAIASTDSRRVSLFDTVAYTQTNSPGGITELGAESAVPIATNSPSTPVRRQIQS